MVIRRIGTLFILAATVLLAQNDPVDLQFIKVVEIMSDTSLYSKTDDTVLSQFKTFSLTKRDIDNCSNCFGQMDKNSLINLSLRFSDSNEKDSLLVQQITAILDESSIILFDSLNCILQKRFNQTPSPTFNHGWLCFDYQYFSTNSSLILSCYKEKGRCRKLKVMLSANSTDEDY